MNDLTAKEMFEALDYDMYEIGFDGSKTYFINGIVEIHFYNTSKTYDYRLVEDDDIAEINVETHKAIHQYMKEKGWLE